VAPQAKNSAQARRYAARVLSLSIDPKKLAKRFPASATSLGTTIARPIGRAGRGLPALMTGREPMIAPSLTGFL